jgi:hypothetical protein
MSRSEAPHVKESTHWYDRDGTPRYEVLDAKGKMRAATLRDARKFGWYPGVTSIIKCAAAPGLERWKLEQTMLAALTLPRFDGENDESFCSRVMRDSGEQARKARESGTVIHAAIQGHYEGKPPSLDMLAHVQGVAETIKQNFGEHEWCAEAACAHPSGYGTKADLSCRGIVLDFKGADFTASDVATLKTWDEHAMQLAATREARGMPDATCAIVYVSRVTPGLCRAIHVDESDLRRGWAMFQALLSYWKAKTGYFPELWTPVAEAA